MASISGPARGCPFLLDARSSRHFAHLALDPAHTQVKGCTFCRDNVGSYFAFSTEETVEAWLQALRQLRARRPDARQVLLIDERPHPHLPALFRALLDATDIAPVELLIKSRVDWLLEHAQTALPEAAEWAERGGHVLNVYLVGFEAFDAFHLELFNKGVSVADNIAAVQCLRDLGARFPKSLEYRSLRAHGIVLFTPWTTPETLLENARAIRSLNFSELRADVLSTRLRLYPHSPLHALADSEGLLVPGFVPGRTDRAIEQGYDASVPWRFKDARVEAIFQACQTLVQSVQQVAECDILEMVTRFVQRWPGLADAPDLAALPMLHALPAWNTALPRTLEVLGPTLATWDREVELVAMGRKPASMKGGVTGENVDGLLLAYRAMGLHAALVSRHDLDPATGRQTPTPGGQRAMIALAREEATLTRLVDEQRRVQEGCGSIPEAGALMGYPPCCIAAFEAVNDQGDNQAMERASFRRAPDRVWPPLLNRLADFRLISHFPCTPDCAASAELAQVAWQALAELDAPAAQRLLDLLAQPIVFLDYQRRARLQGAWNDEGFQVQAIVPLGTDLGAPIAGLRALRPEPTQLVFTYQDGRTVRLATPYPLLAVPGQALHHLASLALTPPAIPAPEPVSAPEPHRPPPPPLPADFPPRLAPGTWLSSVLIARLRVLRGGFELTLRTENAALVLFLRRAADRSWTLSKLGPPDNPVPDAFRAALRSLQAELALDAQRPDSKA